MIPIYGFLQGDTIGLLVLANEEDAVADVAERLVQSASVRVRPGPNRRVLHAGRELDPNLTLRQAGIGALERFDVITQEEA